MRIDVHTHYRTPEFFPAVEDLGVFEELSAYRIIGRQVRSMIGHIPDAEAVKSRLYDMDGAGIDVQMLSIGSMQVYLRDADRAARAARLANDMHDSLVQRFPDRFGVFACLPLPHIDESLAEITRCLDVQGARGINIGCSAGDRPIDDPLFDPVWEELDARGATVFLHPGVKIDGIVGCLDHHLAPDFCSPAEIGVTVMRLVIAGHPVRFPHVRLVIATTGGAIPFMCGRYEHGLRQTSPEVFERIGSIREHLRTFYYDTSVMEEPAVLRAAMEVYGPGRLVLGSDYGRPTVTSQWAVDYVSSSDYLPAEEKQAILDRTAAQILGFGDDSPQGPDQRC